MEVYAVVHCGGVRWLNYQTSNCSETERCQHFVVNFPDPGLEEAIREAIRKYDQIACAKMEGGRVLVREKCGHLEEM